MRTIRSHISKEPISTITNSFRKLIQKDNDKPVGLWYQIDDSWEDWCTDEMPHWIHSNKYALDIDMSSVLVINTAKLFIAFNNKYRIKDNLFADSMYPRYQIDWNTVSNDYQGIQISHYFYQFRLKVGYEWYYGWDIASGCIWDVTCIKSFSKINS